MALENEQQDLQQAVENLNKALNGLSGNTTTASKAQQEAAARYKASMGMIEQSGRQLASFGAGLAKGETDFKSFNTVIDAASSAMGAVAKAIPVFGDAVAGALKAAAEGAKFLVGQIDATSKAFNNLAKTGAVGADGMTGVFRQFTRAGLSLEQFQKAVGENSTTLARFRGLTSDGAEDFSKIVGDLTQGTDDSLRKLGLNADQIGQGAAAFISQQTRLGRAQTMTNDQVTRGTSNYLKELDMLSKVTGESREALQQQQNAALSEARFRAVYQEKMESGNEQQIAAAKEMMTFQSGVSSANKELGKAVRDLTTGVTTSTEAQNLQAATGGRAGKIIDDMNAGLITSAQGHEQLSAVLKENKTIFFDQMKANGEVSSELGNTVGYLDYLGSEFDKNGKMVKKAGEVQDSQTTATDKLTAQTVSAQQSLEGMSIEINKLGFTLLPQTATAVAATTKAMKDMVAWVNKELGRPTGEEDEKALSGKKGAMAGAASMGAAGAVLGSVIPGIGTVIGGAIGAAIGGVAGGAGLIDYGIKGKDGLLEKSGMKENAAVLSGAAPTPPAGSSAGLGSDVDKILETIKKRESGGNYGAQAKGSTASGAYQFIDSTWQAQSKKAGVGMEFKSAKEAPKEIQDAVAKSMVQDILKQAGGDVSKVPLAWYTGNIQGKMSDKALAANNGLTPEMYQSKWMKDYSKSTGVEVPTMASRTTPAGPAGTGPTSLAGPVNPYTAMTPNEANRQQALYTPPPAAAPIPASTDQPVQIMVAQLDQLQQLVASMKTQVSVSEKLLRMQS